jgi:hypothetical protein
MKFGISTFVTDDTVDTVSLARAIEERGSTRSRSASAHTHPGELGAGVSARR